MHSFVITPFGLAVADEARIVLMPDGEDITLAIRETYQSLTFFNSVLTYSHASMLLHFIPDTSGGSTKMLTFDMSPQSRGWTEDDITSVTSLSNFVEGRHREPEALLETTSDTFSVKQFNEGTSAETGLLQTEDIVLGNKTASVRNFFLSYRSTDKEVTVKVYVNNQDNPHHRFTIPASSTLQSKHQIALNVHARVLSLSFESDATDFVIEDMEIPDEEITFNG